jgi:hypothetical protein
VLEALGRGEIPQKVAQAAAWHVANGLTWERLAAEKIDHAGGDADVRFGDPSDPLRPVAGRQWVWLWITAPWGRRRRPSSRGPAM